VATVAQKQIPPASLRSRVGMTSCEGETAGGNSGGFFFHEDVFGSFAIGRWLTRKT
jgi:hypothetical protein